MGLRAILSDPAVRIILVINGVIMLGFGIVAPIIPLYARSFGVGRDAAGLMVSAFAMARLVTDPVAGPIVDRLGERRAAAAGIFGVGASSFLAGIAPTFELVVILRGAGGIGSSILFAAFYSYMLKVVPKDRMARTMSTFFASFNLGIVAGGPLGGVIAGSLGLRAPLFFYAGLLVIAGVMFLAYVRDPHGSRAAEQPGADRAGIPDVKVPFLRAAWLRNVDALKDRRLVILLLVNMAVLWIMAGVYDTLVPLFADEGLGMTEVAIGGAFGVAILGEFAMLYPAGRAADAIGRRPVQIAALLAATVAIGATGFIGATALFFVMMGLMGLCSGAALVPPTAMLSDITPGDSAAAVGLFRFAGDLGFVIGPLVAGATSRTLGFEAAFLIAAAVPFIAMLAMLKMPETLRRGAG